MHQLDIILKIEYWRLHPGMPTGATGRQVWWMPTAGGHVSNHANVTTRSHLLHAMHEWIYTIIHVIYVTGWRWWTATVWEYPGWCRNLGWYGMPHRLPLHSHSHFLLQELDQKWNWHLNILFTNRLSKTTCMCISLFKILYNKCNCGTAIHLYFHLFFSLLVISFV